MKSTPSSLRHRRNLLLAILGLTAAGCAADPDTAAADDAGAGGAGGGGAGGSAAPPACENPEAIMQSDGSPSGLERCADGRLLRVEAVRCVNDLPPFAACETPDGCPGGCQGPHAACVAAGGPDGGCFCATGCATDADCPEDAFCMCGGGSQCVRAGALDEPGHCRTGSDCPSGQCRLGSHSNGCSTEWYVGCDSAASECLTTGDCTTGGPCVPGAEGWVCGAPTEICGRPFNVAGEARTAALVTTGEATARVRPAPACEGVLESLPAGLARDALQAHFEAMTLLEHASIASFAQFMLGLMRFGAPAALLDATAQAMRDEVDHTRRCAALVMRLSGREVVPGALNTAGAAPAGSLAELMVATLAEACVGETLGAIEAHTLAEQCADAELRETLTVIAEDEWRHAVLGWETLRWGVAALRPADAAALREAAERALVDQVQAARAHAAPSDLGHLGLLDAVSRADLFSATGATVILPTLEAILADLERRVPLAA